MAEMNPQKERELVEEYLIQKFGSVDQEEVVKHRVCYDDDKTGYMIFRFETPQSNGYSDFKNWISIPKT